MKKSTVTIIAILFFLFTSCLDCSSFGQTKAIASGDTLIQVSAPITPATFETLTATSSATKYTYKNKVGVAYPVFLSVNDKYFYCRQSKAGKWYKVYITIETPKL